VIAGSWWDGLTMQVTQITDRVGLHVRHVVQATQRPAGQRSIHERFELRVTHVDPCGRVGVGLEVESHPYLRLLASLVRSDHGAWRMGESAEILEARVTPAHDIRS
jgi:hypothetical protein